MGLFCNFFLKHSSILHFNIGLPYQDTRDTTLRIWTRTGPRHATGRSCRVLFPPCMLLPGASTWLGGRGGAGWGEAAVESDTSHSHANVRVSAVAVQRKKGRFFFFIILSCKCVGYGHSLHTLLACGVVKNVQVRGRTCCFFSVSFFTFLQI